MWMQAAQYLALLTCAIFTGAAVYVSWVEHPARIECGRELAATVFGPIYRRAAPMQASLAALCFLFSAATWWLDGGAAWLVAGLLMLSIIPFTLVAILPTNTRLLDPTLNRNSAEAERLLKRWGRLHAARAAASLIALIILGAQLAFA